MMLPEAYFQKKLFVSLPSLIVVSGCSPTAVCCRGMHGCMREAVSAIHGVLVGVGTPLPNFRSPW
jgi:hypothetical protein